MNVRITQQPAQHRDAKPSTTFVRTEVQEVNKSGKPSRQRIFVTVTPELPAPTGPLCTKEGCKCEGREVDHTVWKRKYLTPAKKEAKAAIAEALGDDFEKLGSIWFSAKAGCGCGCSPGFVSERVTDHDLFITAEVDREPTAPARSAGVLKASKEVAGGTKKRQTAKV